MEIRIGQWWFKRCEDGTVRLRHEALPVDDTLVLGVEEWVRVSMLLTRQSDPPKKLSPEIAALLNRQM